METKRVDLMPVGPVSQPRKDKKLLPTFRFNLTLTESTDKTCPEFSYTELMKNALGKEGEEDLSVDPLDPFSKQDKQQDDNLLAIAKSFEEKYGNGIKPSTKRKRRDHPGDMVDLGEGYDLEDPFIDNTEAYDEVVPSNMTTHLGGFYINSGALDFKYCSEDSDSDFAQPKNKKKRIIISDSESEVNENKKKKKLLDGSVLKKKLKKSLSTDSENSEKLIKKKKKLVSSEKIKMAKLKKNRPSMYWKQQQQQQQTATNGQPATAAGASKPSVMVNGEGAVATVTSQDSVASREHTAESDSQSRSTPAKQVTISVVDLDDIEVVQVSKPTSAPPTDNVKPVTEKTEPEDESSAFTSQSTTQKPKLETIPTLPDTLSLKTLSFIEKLKQAAKEKGTESGKSKFFSQEVNDMLLSVEKDTRQSSLSERSAVFSHLAGHLPCGKETLIKRGKKLLQEQQDDKLREPINKLKEAVSTSIPALLEKHASECAAAQSKQQLKQNKVEKKEGGSSESEEEGSNDGSEKPKRFLLPRKKFEWTPHLRQLLCSIVVIKMEHYEMSKVRSQTPEEYLKAFLDAEIKPIWPQGWIQTRMLFKESRSVHSKWTNSQSKPKKMVIPLKSTTSNPVSVVPKTNVSQSLTQPVSSLPKPNPQTLSQVSSSVTKSEDRAIAVSHGTNHPSVLYASPDLQKKPDIIKPVVTKTDNSVATLLDYAENNHGGKAKVATTTEALKLVSSQKVSTNTAGTISSTGVSSSSVKPVQASSKKQAVSRPVTQSSAGTIASTGVSSSSSVKPVQTSSKKQAVSRPVTPSNTATPVGTSQDFLPNFKDFTSTFNQQPLQSYAVQQALSQAGVSIQSTSNVKPRADTPLRTKAATPNVQGGGASSNKTSQYSVKPVSNPNLMASVSNAKPAVGQRGTSPSTNKLTGTASKESSPNTTRQPKGAPMISTMSQQFIASNAASIVAAAVQLSKPSSIVNKTAVQAAMVKSVDSSAKVAATNKMTVPVSAIQVVTTADGKTIRIANPIKMTTADSVVRLGEPPKPVTMVANKSVTMATNKPVTIGTTKTGSALGKLSGKSPVLVSNQAKVSIPQSTASSGSISAGTMNQKGLTQVSKATNQGLGSGNILPSPQQQQHQKRTQGSQQQDRQHHNNPGVKPSPHSQQVIKQQQYPPQHASVTTLPKPSPANNVTSSGKSQAAVVVPNNKPQPTSPKQQQQQNSQQLQNPRSPKSFGGLSLEELQRQMLQKADYTQPRNPVPQPPQNAFNSLTTSPYSSPNSAAAAAFTSMLTRISQGSDPTGASPSLAHTSPSKAADRFQQGSNYVQTGQHSPHTSPTAGHGNQGLFPTHGSPTPTRPAFSPYRYGYPNTGPSQQQYRY